MLLWFEAVFRLPRQYKRLLQLTADAGLIILSFIVAMLLRLDSWHFMDSPSTWLPLLAVIPVSLLLFVRLGFYRAIIRYMTHKAVEALLVGVAASTLCLVMISYLFTLPVPRSVPFIYAMLALLTIGGARFLLRGVYLNNHMRRKIRVVVYGAGAAGRQLVASLREGREYQPVAFIDDAPQLLNASVQELRVNSPESLPGLVETFGVQKVLLAVPTATRARRRAILQSLARFDIPVQTIPGMADVVAGKARIDEIRDVTEEDLLGRDPTPPDPTLIGSRIRGKVVMVTGAGGSIGSELCRQIIRQSPAKLLLLEISEFGLYRIEEELKRLSQEERLKVPIRALLGSVRHAGRMESILKTFGVQTVYHAAAYKHVPMVEHNVCEGISNNVFGTLRTAQAAVAAGVETFILISTDKAVRPTNVMGATKRLAELVCQALAQTQTVTRFSMVRFGNVLGSSGSVVPLFRRQIRAGGPVTVTHPDITRYFMTVPEAAQLVLQAGSMATGGDVFVLDMGQPVKIDGLARQMVRLSGSVPVEAGEGGRPGDIEIVYTGLRPGEKLYEELLIGENVDKTSHPRIMTARESSLPWTGLQTLIDTLRQLCREARLEDIRSLLLQAPLAYAPTGKIVDNVWQKAWATLRCVEPAQSPAQVPGAAGIHPAQTKSSRQSAI